MKNCLFTKCNCMLAGVGCKMSSYFLLLIRVVWGLQFTMAGFGKLSNASQVMPFFESMGLPSFMVYVIGALELVGGILLALGLFSRLAALILAAIMVGAYSTAHKEALFGVFGNFGAFVKEAPFAYLFASLTVLCFGPGCLSLDAWKKKKCDESSSDACCSTSAKPAAHSSCCG